MTLHERITGLRQSVAAFGRPPLGVAADSLKARRDWDLTDPARCDRYWAAVEELNRLLDADERAAYESQAERKASEALERSGAPERLLALSLAPDETPAVALVREWLTSRSSVLVLTGGVGTGKTVAALFGLRQLAHRYVRAAYVRATEVPRFGAWGDSAERFAMVRQAGALVLDDLGTEALGDFGAANLSELVDARYLSSKRTIVTTNLGWRDLESRYGERVADRLREGATVAGTGTGSLRGQNAMATPPRPAQSILGGE